MTSEAAIMLGVSAATISNMMKAGLLLETKEFKHHRGWVMLATEDVLRVGVERGFIKPQHQQQELREEQTA